jgi:hypothetical protein
MGSRSQAGYQASVVSSLTHWVVLLALIDCCLKESSISDRKAWGRASGQGRSSRENTAEFGVLSVHWGKRRLTSRVQSSPMSGAGRRLQLYLLGSLAVWESAALFTKTSSLTIKYFFVFIFYSQFTETFLTERDKLSKWSGIPQLLLKLYATSHLHSDFVECQSILKVTDGALEGLCSGSSDAPTIDLLEIASFCMSCRTLEKFGNVKRRK